MRRTLITLLFLITFIFTFGCKRILCDIEPVCHETDKKCLEEFKKYKKELQKSGECDVIQ